VTRKHQTLIFLQSVSRRVPYRLFAHTYVVAKPGASPAPYFMGNGTRQGMEKTILFYLVLRLRMIGATYPLRHTPSLFSLRQSYRTTCRHIEILPCRCSAS